MPKRLAVFVSGTSTILEAMIEADVPIELVLADRECRGRELAEAAGIPFELVDRKEWGYRPGPNVEWNRKGFTAAVLDELRNYKIDLVAMAGFMTILDKLMFQDYTYANLFINTHPALLPEFPGESAVEDALEYGVKITGCTLHYATAEVDRGPIIAQAAVPVLDDDTLETLHERIKVEERKLYVATLRELLNS